MSVLTPVTGVIEEPGRRATRPASSAERAIIRSRDPPAQHGLPGDLAVVEGDGLGRELLSRLVSLTQDQHDVLVAGLGYRIEDGGAAVGFDLRALRADAARSRISAMIALGILAARIVGGDDHHVGAVLPPHGP